MVARSRASAVSAVVLLWSVVADAAPGDLDASFGEGGVASIAAPPTTHPRGHVGVGVALQPDGKIVVVAESAAHDVLVQRFDAAGTPDPDFGGDGSVTVDFGADDEPFGVAVQPDGRIVVAATSRLTGTSVPRVALARLTTAGDPDASFGTGGTVVTQLGPGATAYALALQPDGRIVVAGGAGAGFFPAAYVARFTPSGALDATFGTGGVFTKTIGIFGDTVYALALQPDGAILAGGITTFGGDYGGWFVLRVLPGGTADASFGTDGVVKTDVNGRNVVSEVLDLVVQPDGRILAGGSTESSGLPSDFAVVRYLADGTPDETWGDDGIVVTPVLDDGPNGWKPTTPVRALALQPDGKVLAIGGGALPIESTMHLIVARYLDDGSLDPSWGDAGLATPDVALADTLGLDAALQPDGRLVVGARDGAQLAAIRFVDAAACGDGFVDEGEGCDDGNVADGDCCSASCTLAADGASCADGNVCTRADVCASGACVGDATPATGCRAAARARLNIRNLASGETSFTWQWLRGDATAASEITSQQYTLCIYDGSGATQPRASLATADSACGSGPCFTATPRQARYADPRGVGGPVRNLLLRAGADGRAAVRLLARGGPLSLPILPLGSPVTAQLHAESGVCWSSTFMTPRRSDASAFDATAK